MKPPKPAARADKTTLWHYLRLFRQDILSAQPAKLYRAKMAEFRAPGLRSFLMNEPGLVDMVLRRRPEDFPKSDRVREGLVPLLGNGVFITNGAAWRKQRRIIDPAFAGGRLRDTFPSIAAASVAAAARLTANPGWTEIEAETSHAAADVIFRTLFSIPISHQIAGQVFAAFKTYQRTQPLLNLAAFLPLPRWMPRFRKAQTTASARKIRGLIRELVEARAAEIAAGVAPDDLATKIMTQPDPETGDTFTVEEMVDQVAIFFLAGHETSASALAWALYLLATHPEAQARVVAEARSLDPKNIAFSDLSKLTFTRDVFREALRLYPPVPMMVRETTAPEEFRGRRVKPGAQVVISPWHMHRHEAQWADPDGFDPDRWKREDNACPARDSYIPFSAGARVCPGAGFAMIEGPLLLAMMARDNVLSADPDRVPVPVAHLTVRAKDGIWLNVARA